MLKNVAGQNITALLLDTAGAAVTTGTTTVYVTGDAGTQASMGTATHEGNGVWSIDVTQAESNYDDIGFTWVNAGAVTVHQHVFTDKSYDRIGATGSGLTSLATAAALATVDTVVDGIQTDLSNGTDGLGAIKADTAAILVDTAEIGAAGAGLTALSTQASVDTIDANVDAILVDTGTTLNDAIAAIAADQKPKVNTALNNIPVYMVLATDNKTPATGLTPTVTISQDGGAFGAIDASSSIAEVGSGWYRLNLAAADMNAAVIYINVTGTGANPVPLTISTVD